MKNEIVLFTDGDVNIEVQINPEQETVWLTQKQMEVLFDVKHATVSEHISNILASGELDETSVGFSDRSTGGRKPKIYNLDMILSVGYRVNSKRGIAFRKWANNVLKQFILQGYAINEKRLQALKKTVDIQSRMLADALDIEEKDVLRRGIKRSQDAFLISKASRYDIKGGICMKKLIASVLTLACILTLVRCGKSDSGDYPATIMVNGTNYYSTDHAVPVEVDESVIQYTTSYAENGIPQKDGEANFNRDLGTPYAVIEDDRVVVLIDNEWIEFKAK